MVTRYPLAPTEAGDRVPVALTLVRELAKDVDHGPGSLDGLLRVLTWICVAITLVIGLAAIRTPAPVRTILVGVAGAMLAMYVFIWLWMRPTAFVVAPDGLVIE